MRVWLAAVFTLTGGLASVAPVIAGGSAETTLVVVNAASPLSQRIANEYVRLRGIPDTHLVRLQGVPSLGGLSVADFRSKIWEPIRDFLREHSLEAEIDVIAYSGDLPYAFGVEVDLRGKRLPDDPYRGSMASLTALTYFARRVEAADPGYLGINHYFRQFVLPRPDPPGEAAGAGAGAKGDLGHGVFEITHGFRHEYVWSSSDLAPWRTGDELDQYYLSTMLAYTGLQGNSFPEVADYLGSAAASDGTHPDGTVYLMANGDVRSETRQPLFNAALGELARRGRKAEILSPGRDGQNGIVPIGRDDVIGVVVGASDFDWPKSKSRLLPGAIAESLTSYGGRFDLPKQTKLTAFLRHGAAGSSGAIQEPYSLLAKFPVPLLHAYYADGCSLAEAFYQSILTPYQLILVGDPLARPFARFADVGLKAPDVAVPWSGTVRLEPLVRPAKGTSVRAVELWVDGQRVASGKADAPIPWDSRSVEDGSHDLRLVAVEDTVIETRSVFRATVSVLNRDRRVEVEQLTRDVEYGQPVVLSGRAEGATGVALRRGHQVLASAAVTGGRWSMTVPSTRLGMGTVAVVVRAEHPDGNGVRSDPLTVVVREPARLPAATLERPEKDGLLAVIRDDTGTRLESVVGGLHGPLGRWMPSGSKPDKVELTGYVHVGRPGFYQLVVQGDGPLRLSLHDEVLLDEADAKGTERFAAVSLDSGWHPLRIEMAAGGKAPFLDVILTGAEAAARLSQDNLAH